ncbi:MAG: GNAT family N-acetyltransferase [Alphaproteobacteria bacterium]|nr:GNAT family N-acetyltransferase [Alphaproteobacteria bacterium]
MSGSFTIDIRPAVTADAVGIAKVQVDAWRDAYVGLLPDQALIDMNATKASPRWMRIIVQMGDPRQFCVAVYDGKVIGFCHGGAQRRALDPMRRRRPNVAEIYTLYVDPNFQGCGIGSALLLRVSRHLGEAGYSSLALSMLSGNRIARRFYEHLGGEMGEESPSVVMGTPVNEILYRWNDIASLLERLEAVVE